MTRKEFLTEFLGALGAIKITWDVDREDFISGTVWYEPTKHFPHCESDEDECQDFCWYASESDVPSSKICLLTQILHRDKLLDIDKITVSRNELYRKFIDVYDGVLEYEAFEDVLEALETIEIPMVDDGKETDIFFIHE